MPVWIQKTKTKLQDSLFRRVHENNLIYNVCWEDPRIDRDVLLFDKISEIVMITSAGCNALDYLLDSPKVIHCIDMNPRQNALLELKRALFRVGSHQQLFGFFGQGAHPQAEEIYRDLLRNEIPGYARKIWDKKIDYFEPKKNGKTFLFRGTSGKIAWMVNKYLKSHKKLRDMIYELFEAHSLDEQRTIYDKIEPRLWTKLINWVMEQQLTMTLLGVPQAQKKLIDSQYEGGMGQYLKDGFRNVFANLPIHENYFWHGYLFGYYTQECCPNYLKKQYFNTIKANESRLHPHTGTIEAFLNENEQTYTHFILLDHQDWMAAHMPQALETEWKAILKRSQKDAQYLLRSAGMNIDFIPQFVEEHITFDSDIAATFHPLDRVGTYASMHVGRLKKTEPHRV